MQRQARRGEYLRLVTSLLQRARVADATAGLWEAADLQWWWRRDQHDDPKNATFWLDGSGLPVAGVVLMDWGDRWGCEVIDRPQQRLVDRQALWRHVEGRCAALGESPIETSIRDDQPEVAAQATAVGFIPTDDQYMACWMDAADRSSIPPLQAGYRLTSRADAADRPHHMITRSGPLVEQLLRECSLYQPQLDLAIEAPDGEIAAYGLFWADLTTGVGLVEPMRTEDDHQGRGLARHLLTTGLDRLASLGCRRLKVSYLTRNDVARRLYVHAGFEPRTPSRTYLRPAEQCLSDRTGTARSR